MDERVSSGKNLWNSRVLAWSEIVKENWKMRLVMKWHVWKEVIVRETEFPEEEGGKTDQEVDSWDEVTQTEKSDWWLYSGAGWWSSYIDNR